jgi:hypothetical protein
MTCPCCIEIPAGQNAGVRVESCLAGSRAVAAAAMAAFCWKLADWDRDAIKWRGVHHAEVLTKVADQE